MTYPMPKKQAMLCACALSILITASANADAMALNEKDDITPFLEEIIVTARKRKEDVLKAPVAVNVFSWEDIANAGIVDLQDIALHTPGFSYREGFGRLFSEGNNRPVMRGMSSILGEANAGYFIDGVYVAGPISAFDLTNLSRVEVVRGPQSSLYGRGAFAGAINFVTRPPNHITQGRAEATAGSNGYKSINTYLSGELSENVAGEINGRFYNRGGLYQNTATGNKDLGGQQSFRLGGKLDIEASPSLNIYIHGNWAEDKDEGYAYAPWNGGESREDGISANQSNCYAPAVFMAVPGMRFTSTQARGYYCGEISVPATYYGDFGGLNSVDRSTGNLIADITYTFDNDATFKSLTGYTKMNYSQAELPAYYAGGSTVWEKGSQSYLSQELRYSSDQNQEGRFMVGGYYFRSNTGDMVNVSFNPLTETLADQNTSLTNNDSYIENKAIFAAVDYNITNQITVTGEMRYQSETKKLLGADFDGDNSITFNAFLPRFAVTYSPQRDFIVYANVAKGNKPGGFNDDVYKNSLDSGDRSYWRDLNRGTYEESSVWSYEVGTKANLSDAFKVNASVFYLDWAGQQLTQADALKRAGSPRQTTVTFITNAGKSEVKGFELDAKWQVTPDLEIGAAYSYSHATFKNYLDENWRDLQDTNGWYTGQAIAAVIFPDGDIDAVPSLLPSGVELDDSKAPLDSDGDGLADRFFVIDTVDPDGQVKGNDLPQTPRHQISLSGTYTFTLLNDYEGFIRTDYIYESKRYVQAANLAWMGDTQKLNLRAGFKKGSITVTFWADNLTKNATPEVVIRYADFQNILMIPSQVRSGSRFTFNRDFAVTAPMVRSFGITLSSSF